MSANFGAGRIKRVRAFLRLSLLTAALGGVVFTLCGECFPVPILSLFIGVTEESAALAPAMMRPYFLIFLFMGINVVSTYYLQSTLREKDSLIVSLLRSLIVSGVILFVLPLFTGLTGVMAALPLSEFVVALIALRFVFQRRPAGEDA